MRKIISLLILAYWSHAVQAQMLYRTGFESTNEPFGNNASGWKFRPAGKNKLKSNGICKTPAATGKQSLSPGVGSGRYGAAFTRQFKPALIHETLWIEFDLMISDAKAKGYFGFIYLGGIDRSAKKHSGCIQQLLFYRNKLVYSGGNAPFVLPEKKWFHIAMKLDFKSSACSIYINGKLLKGSLPFRTKGLKAITQIKLGGAAGKGMTYYDNLYIGASPAPPIKSCKQPKPGTLPFAVIGKTLIPPEIDGKLDDQCYKKAAILTPFQTPAGNKMAKQQTQVMVCYDNEYLYIAFRCFDARLDPLLNQLDRFSAKRKKRDSAVWTDDSVELFIRPDPASGKYYHLAVNLAGTLYDTARPAPGAAWNSEAKTGVGRNDKAWIVEIAVPLKNIGITKVTNGLVCQINFCRNTTWQRENTCWSPTGGNFHIIDRFGKIKFGLKPPPVQEIILPEKIIDGINQLGINKSSLPFAIQTSLSYGRGETVYEAVVMPEKKKISFICHRSGNRRSARKLKLNASEFNPDTGELLLRTPLVSYPAPVASPFNTSLVAQTSKLLIKDIDHIYINRGGARTAYLLIRADKTVRKKISRCQVNLELPVYLQLLNPASSPRTAPVPESFQVIPFEKNGRAMRRYEMIWTAKHIYSKQPFSRNNRYNAPIPLVIVADKNAPLKTGNATIYTVASKLREPPMSLPVTVLPVITGKRPETFPVITWGTKNNELYASLNSTEQQAFLHNRIKAGFNILGLNELGGSFLSEKQQQTIRQAGFALIGGIPRNRMKTWRSNAFEGAEAFLKQHSDSRAETALGQKLPDCICITELLNPTGSYRIEFKKYIGPLAKKYRILCWDYEVRPADNNSTCWCSRCLKKFAGFAKIPSNGLSASVILKKYQNQWIDFQCRRNAALAMTLRQLIKAANPQCKFTVYSGYQSQHTRDSYGVDWTMMQSAIDYAMCGYGRPMTAITDTLTAIAPKKLIGGLLIFVWFNSSYNMSNVKIDLFRRLTDSRGGLMTFYDVQADGRFWTAIGELTNLVHKYENLFLNCVRDDATVKPVANCTQNDLAVLKGPGGKRLLFIFNNSAKNRNSSVKDISTGKIHVLNIPPKDVKFMILK
jgi:cellulose/xylan binding protein with CBM9 domain